MWQLLCLILPSLLRVHTLSVGSPRTVKQEDLEERERHTKDTGSLFFTSVWEALGFGHASKWGQRTKATKLDYRPKKPVVPPQL